MANRQENDANSRGARFERLRMEVAELKRLCTALPECDAIGKLRGTLGRMDNTLTACHASGDLTMFHQNVGAAEELVRRIHAVDPLTQLLIRLSALSRDTTHIGAHADLS
jgi:hypothetical protein